MVAGQQWQYAHLQFYVRKNAVSPKIEGSFSSTNVVVIWATGPATYAKTDATKLGLSEISKVPKYLDEHYLPVVFN